MLMKFKILVVFGLMISLLAGCGSNPVEEDLLTYMNESLPSLSEQELEAVALYDSVSGPNYTDDETMYYTILDEVIPKYRVFIDNLENVEIETEELTKIHEIYIEAVNIQNSGFLTILTAIEEQDSEKINEANAKLTEARTMIRDYQNKLDALAEENDVIIE
jgi:hypothetical protein